MHCWESLATIISSPEANDIILDIGMPVRHHDLRYNCRVIVLNRQIRLIRPKMTFCEEGNYFEGEFPILQNLYWEDLGSSLREEDARPILCCFPHFLANTETNVPIARWFTPWLHQRVVEDYLLEDIVGNITGQRVVPFGDAVLDTLDTTSLACVTCQELSAHIPMGLDGVEIFTDGGGSSSELRKLQTRVALIQEATRQNGGIYVYSNQRGCSGDRLHCKLDHSSIPISGKARALFYPVEEANSILCHLPQLLTMQALTCL